MHIAKKILKEIKDTLLYKYDISVIRNKWKTFEEPLLIDIEGNLDIKAFEDRQEKAIHIIKKILSKHGKADIVGFLGELASLEPKIQELQPWVRDHVVHAINTFILGVYILEKVDFPKFEGGRFDYPFMWKLCGPTHDLGYPIEISHNVRKPFIEKINSILDKIGTSSPRVKIGIYPENLDMLNDNWDANDIIQKRLDEWNFGMDIKDYYKWLQNNTKIDHGVISALAQLKIIEAQYYDANPKREKRDITKNDFNYNQINFELDIVSASSALFIHNIYPEYPGFKNKISFSIAPLAFLLYLCDTFQEWDRYSENKPVYSGNDFNIKCTKKSISLFVPPELEKKIINALKKRLSGLRIKVNGKIAIS